MFSGAHRKAFLLLAVGVVVVAPAGCSVPGGSGPPRPELEVVVHGVLEATCAGPGCAGSTALTVTNTGDSDTTEGISFTTDPSHPSLFVRAGACTPNSDGTTIPAGQSCDYLLTFAGVGLPPDSGVVAATTAGAEPASAAFTTQIVPPSP